MFFDTYVVKISSIDFSGFVAVSLPSEEYSVDPATHVHPISKTIFFWVHVQLGLSLTKNRIN